MNYQYSNECIGKRVAFLRKQQKLSQVQLADLIGTTSKHVSEIERGKTGISIDTQILLCETLHCSMDFLIRGKEFATIDFLLPDRILEIFKSNDENEIGLILEYLQFYNRIHKDK